MIKALFFASLAAFLLGCSHTTPNTIQIGGESGGSAIKATRNGIYINPSLLGLENNSDISIHTASDNEITFDVSRRQDAPEAYEPKGSAF